MTMGIISRKISMWKVILLVFYKSQNTLAFLQYSIAL